MGVNALFNNNASYNTAVGDSALLGVNGNSNVAIGVNAGRSLTTGHGNVCIGVNVLGIAGESDTTRIKNVYSSLASGRTVYVDSDNKIGTLSSSRRFKEEIKPMDKASETVLALKPVTFRYKKEIDANRTKQFGLLAEEVEKVNADLVTRDEQGKPETVLYEAVNAMLLNEFLKEHRRIEKQESKIAEQEATITQLKSTVAKQEAIVTKEEATIALAQKHIEAITTGLAKVNNQLELSKCMQQVAANDQ